MLTRQLGNTDMHISPIGFGAWAVGGAGWEYAWSAQDDTDSIAAIHRALDLGINWIDTAAVYGLGHSEEIVARALKGMAHRPYVFTKCALRWDSKGSVFVSLKRDSIMEECEDSLRRLQVETIDLYQIHWPDDASVDIEEGWTAMLDLQKAGKVRWIAVSNFNVEQLERCAKIAPVSALQPPYSLVNPDVETEILPYCLRHNIGVIVYSPMASGLLTGKMTRERIASLPDDDWRSRSDDFKEPRLTRNLKLADKCAEIGQRHGRMAGEVAIAWTLYNPAVTGAIVGARSASQVEGFIGALDFRLSDAEFAEIEALRRSL
jgi:aryl-alcohol dehydrogenase-like predicted oxidoreductase